MDTSQLFYHKGLSVPVCSWSSTSCLSPSDLLSFHLLHCHFKTVCEGSHPEYDLPRGASFIQQPACFTSHFHCSVVFRDIDVLQLYTSLFTEVSNSVLPRMKQPWTLVHGLLCKCVHPLGCIQKWNYEVLCKFMLRFSGAATLFFQMATLFYISMSNMWVIFSVISLALLTTFSFSWSNRCFIVFHCGFDLMLNIF